MKIVLTGGTGFIGSHVLMQLVNDGHDVTVLARNPHKVPYFETINRVKILPIGMHDYEAIPTALVGADAVVHVALSMVGTTAYDILMSDTADTVFLATEAAKAGVSKFVYTASTAVVDSVYASSNPVCINKDEKLVTISKRHDPCTYYGATKAASEDFLFSIAGETSMNVSIIRPGYTFGNPVVPGAYTQPDNRFETIVKNAIQGFDIEVIKNDGTQFIWADDIALVYACVLRSTSTKNTYYAMSKQFVTWEQIAHDAVNVCNSSSRIVVRDQGWSNKPVLFDVSDIKNDFGLEFSAYPHIESHIQYYREKYMKQYKK